jgi:hypothetical protein
MKSISFFKITIPLNTGILLAFLITGCGEDSNTSATLESSSVSVFSLSSVSSSSYANSSYSSVSSSTSVALSSSSVSALCLDDSTFENSAGYYGACIRFGGNLLVGEWTNIDGYSHWLFNEDGTGSYDNTYERYVYSFGIDREGLLLSLIKNDQTINYYHYSDSNDSCIITQRVFDGELIVDATDTWCHYNRQAYILDDVNNSTFSKNDLGYYGDQVLWGNHSVIGSWGYALTSGGSYTFLIFDENGSMHQESAFTTGGSFIPNFPTSTYGVSSNGRIMYAFNQSYEIIGLYESCYLMQNSEDDLQYKLCKRDENTSL